MFFSSCRNWSCVQPWSNERLHNTHFQPKYLSLTLSLSMRFLQSAGTSLLDFFSFARSIFIVKVFVDYYVDLLLQHLRLYHDLIYDSISMVII